MADADAALKKFRLFGNKHEGASPCHVVSLCAKR